MVREEQLRLLKGLINHLDNKTNVNAGGILKTPADTYISEDRFKKEWNSFFLNHQRYLLYCFGFSLFLVVTSHLTNSFSSSRTSPASIIYLLTAESVQPIL